MTTKKERITAKAKEMLSASPAGLRFSKLVKNLQAEFPNDPYGTITGTVWNLDARFPDEIYKASKGLFRLTQFRTEQDVPAVSPQQSEAPVPTIREPDFYESFAQYLVGDLEECTTAIALGGNKFGSKWALRTCSVCSDPGKVTS